MRDHCGMVSMTFRLPARIKEPHKDIRLRQFMRELMDQERIQVAYIGVYSPLPNPHIHLSLSFTSKEAGAFQLSSFLKWQVRWNQLVRYRSGGLVIKEIYDSEGWNEYMFKHRHPDVLPVFYNKKLLKKFSSEDGHA